MECPQYIQKHIHILYSGFSFKAALSETPPKVYTPTGPSSISTIKMMAHILLQ